jgi:hypothetical protein
MQVSRKQTGVERQDAARAKLGCETANQRDEPTLWIVTVRVDVKLPVHYDVPNQLPHQVPGA